MVFSRTSPMVDRSAWKLISTAIDASSARLDQGSTMNIAVYRSVSETAVPRTVAPARMSATIDLDKILPRRGLTVSDRRPAGCATTMPNGRSLRSFVCRKFFIVLLPCSTSHKRSLARKRKKANSARVTARTRLTLSKPQFPRGDIKSTKGYKIASPGV